MLLRNKISIIFLSLWLFENYFILTTFYSTSTDNKVLKSHVEYLQNEVKSLKQNLSQSQSSFIQCQELQNELKHVKHQLALTIKNTNVHPSNYVIKIY
jgi:cell shape-determining protein MreC